MLKKQREEALKRMKNLNLHENVIRDFKEGILNRSQDGGFIFWLSEDEEKIVEKWSEETGNLPYHVILNKTGMGTMLSIFYISKHEDEWEMDNKDIEEGYAVVYVMNLDHERFSEFGSIVFKRRIGGLVRLG